jgi:hypothetical protein
VAGKLGLSDIEKSNDSLEIRVWWQASIYSPSSVWVIHKQSDSLAATRIDYFPHYDETIGIDSMQTFNQFPVSGTWTDYYKKINLSSFWKVPFHYELNGDYECADGESVTIEIFDSHTYKSVTYPCFMLYKDSPEYKEFASLVSSIIALK